MNKEILRLAIPNIISNISVPLLSTVDTMLMGRISELHLGAVGVGAMIFNFVYWNFGFLRMGTTGITAQAYGREDTAGMAYTLGRAMVVALGLSVLILVFQYGFSQLSYLLMNITAEQLPLVETYFDIRIWAAPATLMLYALMGWYFGMQNALYPLILTISINVVNVVGNIFFVKYLGYEVAGVAYATVIAQYVGVLMGLGLLYWRYGEVVRRINLRELMIWKQLEQFLTINGDIFLRTFCLTFAFGFLYSQSSLAGETILAINTILLQFLNWMSYGVDGFAFAAESLVGKYAGAADRRKLGEVIRRSFWWGMGLAGGFSLWYGLAGESLLWVFTDKAELVEQALEYLPWMVLFPMLSTPCYLWDGIYIGLTASRAMRNTMLLALLLYLPLHFLWAPLFFNHGMWLAFLMFMVLRGILQWVFYEKSIKRKMI